MSSIEQIVKDRFSAYFDKRDWKRFKGVAECYFQRAVYLKRLDIEYNINTEKIYSALLARNIQKRLNIGIGTELLIKAFYLKEGWMINLVKNKKNNMANFPFSQKEIKKNFHEDNTFTLNDLIQNLGKVKKFKNRALIDEGLRIAKVFRNKEGHMVTKQHKYNKNDYSKIESSLVQFYKEAFNEILKITSKTITN